MPFARLRPYLIVLVLAPASGFALSRPVGFKLIVAWCSRRNLECGKKQNVHVVIYQSGEKAEAGVSEGVRSGYVDDTVLASGEVGQPAAS